MAKIHVINDNTFEVTLPGTPETTHTVTLSDEYHHKLTRNSISKAQLVEEAFTFLTKHQRNTDIFSEFALEIIKEYFPEFEAEMKRHFA